MPDAVAEGIAALGRRVVAAGLVVAAGGNIAARDPDTETVLVTPRGLALDQLQSAALARVNLDGSPPPGSTTAPSTELALHLAAFRARPDALVCLHLHPP